jgi:hypothetical protein
MSVNRACQPNVSKTGRLTVQILHIPCGEMSSTIRAPHTLQRLVWQTRLRGRIFVLATLMLLLGVTLLPTTAAQAATSAGMLQHHVSAQPIPTPSVRADTQLVFSVGTLSRVEQQTVTVAFDDGQTETYRLVPGTTIQTQNGDAQVLADLDVGSTIVVIADETDLTALTIVNGGDAGFHDAGPADIRGHTEECASCEPTASPAPLR